MDFAFATYFRHFQLYKYVFTPEPVVALHFNIPKPPEIAVPAEDPPAAAEEAARLREPGGPPPFYLAAAWALERAAAREVREDQVEGDDRGRTAAPAV